MRVRTVSEGKNGKPKYGTKHRIANKIAKCTINSLTSNLAKLQNFENSNVEKT